MRARTAAACCARMPTSSRTLNTSDVLSSPVGCARVVRRRARGSASRCRARPGCRAREHVEAVRRPPRPRRRSPPTPASSRRPLGRARVARLLARVGTPGRCVAEPAAGTARAPADARRRAGRRASVVPARASRQWRTGERRSRRRCASGESTSRSSVCATMPSVEFSTGTTPRSRAPALDLAEHLGDRCWPATYSAAAPNCCARRQVRVRRLAGPRYATRRRCSRLRDAEMISRKIARTSRVGERAAVRPRPAASSTPFSRSGA